MSTERPKKGLAFLEGCEDKWWGNSSLKTHVGWHRSLYHVQLGEYETALTQFDNVIMPLVRKGMQCSLVHRRRCRIAQS